MISIIVPLYNKEKFIKKTLDSVLNQSFKDFEVLVVDDGSTDSSITVVQSYQDKRINLIKKENGGVSSARNLGIKRANGDWILFLDADDELEPECLDTFYKSTLIHPEIKIIVSNFWIVSMDGTRKTFSKWRNSKILDNPLKYIWYKRIYPRPGNTLIHKDVFMTHSGYIENMSYNEDFEFSLRIVSSYKVFYISCNSMSYNKIAEGASGRIHAKENDFAFMIPSISHESIYRKLILYNLLKYNLNRRRNTIYELDATKVIDLSFSKRFKFKYFIYAFIRKVIC